MPSRAYALLAALALMVIVACGDPYLHTNPYDPAVPVAITITGPDTLFSSFEYATFGVQTDPAFPDTAISWSALGLLAAGPPTFYSYGPPLWPATFTATIQAGIGAIDTTIGLDYTALQVKAWRHVGTKTVVVTQRVTHIQLRCPDTHACDTLAAGGVWSVWVDGFDALNQKIFSLVSATANPVTGTPIATFAARDTTIASVAPVGIRAANVTALKTGSTWIVATRGPLLDSLQLVVH